MVTGVQTCALPILGRKTFESIGRPLPNRTTIVLSRSQFAYPGVQVFSDLGQIDPTHDTRDIFICGGAQIYEQALPLCSELFLTLVKRRVEGDILFPPFEDRFEFQEEIFDGPEFRIVRYRNRSMGR